MYPSRTARRLSALAVAVSVALVAAPAPVWAAPTAAEMQDLSPDHWAYRAIQQLMEKYGVMEGFPDQTFRGTKTVSRYELAAALTKVMQRLDVVASARAPAAAPKPAITAADKAMVDKLKLEFKTELEALTARVQKNEDVLKTLQESMAKLVTVAGRVTTVAADETLDIGKDRTAPYLASSLSVSFKGKISESTTYDTNVAGTVKAGGSGDVPAVMSGALGRTPVDDRVSVKSARFTSKIGAATVNVGRFPLWLVGFGPGTDLSFQSGDFDVGAGAVGPDAASLRVGSDVSATVSSELGPVTVQGGLNSNILIVQTAVTLGPVTLKGGYETDHKAITQAVLNSGQRVKTTDNAAVVVDVGGEGPFGATLQANATNLSLTAYGGGVRANLAGINANLVGMFNSDPGQSVTVVSFGGILGFPNYQLGPVRTPSFLLAATDNYTTAAPARADGKETIGPGGQALGKNAGLTVRVNLENPVIPGLIAEYNIQAKLIESIFAPNPADPITSESVLIKSVVKF